MREEDREVGKIKVAKENLLKNDIYVDIISQAKCLSTDKLKKYDKIEVVNFIAYKTKEN
ncbi:MAG: hypothetical protein ACR5KW_00580 [Wolbachia sp.]